MKPLALLAAFLLSALPTGADEPDLLATYHADNGSLPPEYAWSANLRILKDGTILVARCKGYEVEPPGCQTMTGQVDPAALTALLAAARDSGLLQRPAAENPDPPIGGGGVSGSVRVDGAVIDLPRDPDASDAGRVKAVLQAIAAAIPTDLTPLLAD